MERFLLLWDELDDLVGAARHMALNTADAVAHGFTAGRRSAMTTLTTWTGAGSAALGDASTDP